MELNFESPPIDEVVIGLSFEPLTKFTAPFTGDFWDAIGRDIFVSMEQQSTLIAPSSPELDPIEVPPFLRLWFIDKSGNNLVQLQHDKFFFNWRRLNSTDYPRYKNISSSFLDVYEKFLSFIEDKDLGVLAITGCEISYINNIVLKEGLSPAQYLGHVFKDIKWSIDQLPEPKGFAFSYAFDFDNQTQVIVKIGSAKKPSKNENLIRMEITVTGNPDDLSIEGVKKWTNHAHDSVMQCFDGFTTMDIQKSVWGKTS